MMQSIVFLNLRFSDFYSKNLFSQLKNENNLRMVAVLDQQFKDRVSESLLSHFDYIYVINAKSKDGFLAEFDFEQLSSIIEIEKKLSEQVKIVCADEFNLLNAGRLRRKFFIPGYTDLELMIYRDKVKMKEKLQNAGIRVPKFRMIEEGVSFENLVNTIGLPFVIKPMDSCGSFGVHIIKNHADYLLAMKKLIHMKNSIEAEEYIDGKLYHVDSCTMDGKISFICANEYTCPNYDYIKGKVLGSIPLSQSDSLGKSLIEFATQTLQVLGSNNLVNHMEIFVTSKNELVFLEVSARPPGALLNLTHQINFNINLMDYDFFLQTGLFTQVVTPTNDSLAFWALFPLKPGKISKFNDINVSSQVDITYFRKKGETILPHECNSIVGKMAHAIFHHQNPSILHKDFEDIQTFSLANMQSI